MYLLHRIGPRYDSNWNTLDEILASEGPISFDGVYTEVFEHYKALKGKDVTFFASGKYVGSTNSFDVGQLPGKFCTWPQIEEMASYLGAKIGYHGWAHKRCVGLSLSTILDELEKIAPVCSPIFAWPHGVCDDAAIHVARKMGYLEAYCAGPHGDDSQYQKRRRYLGW